MTDSNCNFLAVLIKIRGHFIFNMVLYKNKHNTIDSADGRTDVTHVWMNDRQYIYILRYFSSLYIGFPTHSQCCSCLIISKVQRIEWQCSAWSILTYLDAPVSYVGSESSLRYVGWVTVGA